jgi:type IV pilus assembly protein PilM
MMGKLQRWLSDPPPDRVFEIAEYSLAEATSRNPGQPHETKLEERGLAASPSVPNIPNPEPYRNALARLAAGDGAKRMTTALVIPDYAVRMTILDFEEFPAGEPERLALLRFRLRKSVPFPIDEAQLSYSMQMEEKGRIEILAVTIARPILQEYETIFMDAGYRIGVVIPSSLAALPLCATSEKGTTLLAKVAGPILTVLLTDQGRVRLVRCLDLTIDEHEKQQGWDTTVAPLLQQTIAFAEDQLGQKVSRALLCGFGEETDRLGAQMEREFGIPFSPLVSKFGNASTGTAGMFGLLEHFAGGAAQRAPINLASQPFRHERAQTATLALAGSLLLCSLFVLTGLIVRSHAQAADLRRQIDVQEGVLQRLQREQGQFSSVLSKPENADIFSKSVFLNELIARRGLSWTRVFKDMETVMPANMRLLGIRLPQVGADDSDGINRVQLDMFVGATQPGAVINLLKNLEKSSMFGSASVVNQSPPTQNDPLYKYRVTVAYAQKI